MIFRDVHTIVFEPWKLDCRREGVEDQELSRVVRMVDCLVECLSSPIRVLECQGLDKWAYDFLLKPLLLAVEWRATRAAATAAYRAFCTALMSGPYAHEVPVYLSVLVAVESEQQGVYSALSSHRLLLYEAAANSRKGAHH